MATILNKPRNSYMEFEKVYFWTDTIKDWKHLLKPDKYKQILIDCWIELVGRQLIRVYGFVIMPNHLHCVWELIEMNGKEKPHASFNKYTSHLILADLKAFHPQVVPYFRVEEKERKYRIWQRDPLAVLMDRLSKMEQKLTYLHNNPLQAHWNLASRPEIYFWSSASFYETGNDPWGFLTHYKDRFC